MELSNTIMVMRIAGEYLHGKEVKQCNCDALSSVVSKYVIDACVFERYKWRQKDKCCKPVSNWHHHYKYFPWTQLLCLVNNKEYGWCIWSENLKMICVTTVVPGSQHSSWFTKMILLHQNYLGLLPLVNPLRNERTLLLGFSLTSIISAIKARFNQLLHANCTLHIQNYRTRDWTWLFHSCSPFPNHCQCTVFNKRALRCWIWREDLPRKREDQQNKCITSELLITCSTKWRGHPPPVSRLGLRRYLI